MINPRSLSVSDDTDETAKKNNYMDEKIVARGAITVTSVYDGQNGRGVVKTIIEYQTGTSGTTMPTGTWQTAVPTPRQGMFLWTRTTVTYTSGAPSVLYSVAYYATNGTNGKDGLPGKDGTGITGTTVRYAKSTSGTVAPTSGWQDTIPSVPAGQYLWTKTTWAYSDGTSEDGYSVAKQGDTGAAGVGISAVSSYYVTSVKPNGVTRSNTTGWVKGVFQQPTSDKPYAWKYVETTKTNGSKEYSDCELVATYNAGVNPNLLEDTDFRDDVHMEKWNEKLSINWLGGVTPLKDYNTGILDCVLQGRNAFRGGTWFARDKIAYKTILGQSVIKKLKPATWYTLSYWIRTAQDSMFYTPVTSGLYGFNKYRLYLVKGHRYQFQIKGYISAEAQAAGKKLLACVFNEGWSYSKGLDITTTSSSYATMEFNDVPEDGEYFVMFYAYPQNGDTTKNVTIERAWITDMSEHSVVYIGDSVVDRNFKCYFDGVESTPTSYGAVNYPCQNVGNLSFHTYTFKTKDILPDKANVVFRLCPSLVIGRASDGAYGGIAYTEICMPKLEEGMQATGYVANEASLRGYRGPTLRGPQAWSDCAVGYNFQTGGDGDEWKDAVMYKDNYYSCVKNHTKTADNYPGSTADINNHYWQLGDKIELIATKILLAQYALVKNLGVESIDMRDKYGNILFQAKDGNVQCKTGTFDGITVTNAKILSGLFGGFKIVGSGLTNDPFTNDAYIIFRNDIHKCFAGIGGNVLPAASGARAVARFENEDLKEDWFSGRNVALLLSAKNGKHNHAFLGSGNGNLNGWIAGFKYSRFTCSKANTIYDLGESSVDENNMWIVYSNVSGSGVALPKLAAVRAALDIDSNTPFAVKFTILADIHSNGFWIYGRNDQNDSTGKKPWKVEEMPLIVNWDNNADESISMGSCDHEGFLLVYDPTRTDTLDGYTTKWTARRLTWQH